MCRSVPQIETARTRTSTSIGPIVGILAVSSDSPRPACILRNAFIASLPLPLHPRAYCHDRWSRHKDAIVAQETPVHSVLVVPNVCRLTRTVIELGGDQVLSLRRY